MQGLVLGRGTLFDARKRGATDNAIDGNELRIIALLTGTFGRPIAGGVIDKMRRACAIWQEGDKGLAQIYLALAGLPRIGDWDAYCLHLADKSLARGVTPFELMKAIGFPEAAREVEKYSENQPRVPSGSGRESGRWTSGAGGSGSGGGADAESGQGTPGNDASGSASGDDAGSEPESAQGTTGSVGSGSGALDRLPRNAYVEAFVPKVRGGVISDASPDGIVPGAQYAQANPTPVITPEIMDKIIRDHGPDAKAKKGSFDQEFANSAMITVLIQEAWAKANSSGVAPARRISDRMVIGAELVLRNFETGEKTPIMIGHSGTELNTPSIETNTYVVILDSNNYVITCYPINPDDPVNPFEE